jgi:hypothetical protein
MTDVSIDFAAMEASRTAYANMRSSLDSATSGLGAVSGAAVPQDELRRRLEDLHDSWGGGLDKLGRYAEDESTGLQGILEAFQGLDSELAASMEPEGGAAA